MKSDPIIDFYGTIIEVRGDPDCPVVYTVRLEREPIGPPDFDRLTPDQAEDLGERLIKAAKATRR